MASKSQFVLVIVLCVAVLVRLLLVLLEDSWPLLDVRKNTSDEFVVFTGSTYLVRVSET